MALRNLIVVILFGSISSFGFCTAPTLAGQILDTVPAVSTVDPARYASASVVDQDTDGKAVWSLKNQQPVTQPFYPGSIFTTPLPANADTHCWNPAVPEGGSPVECSSSAPDQAIVNNIFSSSDSAGGYSASGTGLGTSSQGNGFYYSDGTKPIYEVTATSACPASGALNCPTNKYFHLLPGAYFDSCAGDENISIWDQSSDIDPTPGGRILSAYVFNNGACTTNVLTSPSCTCKTTACAATTSACHLSLYYGGVNFPFNDPHAIGDGINSAGFPPQAGFPREAEIEANVMNHALMLGVNCLASTNGAANPPVFPATGNVRGCPGTNTLSPLNGSLFWIDSAYPCASLPLWQQPFCTALQTYGGYIHVTGGDAFYQGGLFVMPIEGATAHAQANLNDPMFNGPNTRSAPAWIIANGGVSGCSGGFPRTCTGSNGLEVIEDSATSATKIDWTIFNMPGLITGHHLHILDPCVPKFMAGQSGGC